VRSVRGVTAFTYARVSSLTTLHMALHKMIDIQNNMDTRVSSAIW